MLWKNETIFILRLKFIQNKKHSVAHAIYYRSLQMGNVAITCSFKAVLVITFLSVLSSLKPQNNKNQN